MEGPERSTKSHRGPHHTQSITTHQRERERERERERREREREKREREQERERARQRERQRKREQKRGKKVQQAHPSTQHDIPRQKRKHSKTR